MTLQPPEIYFLYKSIAHLCRTGLFSIFSRLIARSLGFFFCWLLLHYFRFWRLSLGLNPSVSIDNIRVRCWANKQELTNHSVSLGGLRWYAPVPRTPGDA